MKRPLLLVVALNLAALAVLSVGYPHLMISPGLPIEAHGELGEDCFVCHTPFLGSTADKCIACHDVAKIGLVTTKGVPIGKERKNVAFHRELIEDDCVACHSEHRGVQPFRPIGRFSHGLLKAPVREACEGCHAGPDDALHRKSEGNCGACHSVEGWLPADFDHDRHFRFDRQHEADCGTCHPGSDYGTYTCYGCHEHSRSKIREEHLEEGIHDYENCVECHRSGDEEEAERIWRSGRRGLPQGERDRHRGDEDHRERREEDD